MRKILTENERKQRKSEENKRYREKHKEQIKKYRDEHKDYFKKYRENYKTNPISQKSRASKLLHSYNREDEKYGRGKGDLTSQWIVDNIFTKPCAHCGKTGWNVIGCNRLDNSKPHTMDNVEPCCIECNKRLPRK